MVDWPMRTIASVITDTIDYRGKTPPRSEVGIPTISAKHVKRGRVEHCGERFVSPETYDRWTTRGFIKPGDVLITTEAPVAEVARVPSDQTYLITRRVIALRVDPTEADESFLMYSMLAHHNRSALANLGHGATVPRVFKGDILGFQLPMPSVAIQARIGLILETIDDLIENNRRRVEMLERMARAIYREWFVHFRYPGHENATFVDSDLGPIPEGWAWRPFTDVASFMNGFAFKPAHLGEEGRPVIKIKQLKGGVSSDTPRSDASAIKEKYWIEPGDLLMSWSAHLGVYWWMDEPGLLNQHLFKVSAVAEYPELYLFYDLDRAMPQFWDRAQGTTMRHIKRAALTEVDTLAADLRVVERFVESVEPLVASATLLRNAAAELQSLRDLLLPKLVTGQIDVSDLDLDAIVEKAGV